VCWHLNPTFGGERVIPHLTRLVGPNINSRKASGNEYRQIASESVAGGGWASSRILAGSWRTTIKPSEGNLGLCCLFSKDPFSYQGSGGMKNRGKQIELQIKIPATLPGSFFSFVSPAYLN